MDMSGPGVILVGIFFYFLLMPYLSLPNVVFSFMLANKLNQHPKYAKLRNLALLFPIAGVGFYLTVDLFETWNLGGLWMLLLAGLSLTPVFLYLVVTKQIKKPSLKFKTKNLR